LKSASRQSGSGASQNLHAASSLLPLHWSCHRAMHRAWTCGGGVYGERSKTINYKKNRGDVTPRDKTSREASSLAKGRDDARRAPIAGTRTASGARRARRCGRRGRSSTLLLLRRDARGGRGQRGRRSWGARPRVRARFCIFLRRVRTRRARARRRTRASTRVARTRRRREGEGVHARCETHRRRWKTSRPSSFPSLRGRSLGRARVLSLISISSVPFFNRARSPRSPRRTPSSRAPMRIARPSASVRVFATRACVFARGRVVRCDASERWRNVSRETTRLFRRKRC